MTKWTAADMPVQTGRSFVVTGTGGLGYEDALALAKAGAEVIMGGRNATSGAEAVAQIRGRGARRECPLCHARPVGPRVGPAF